MLNYILLLAPAVLSFGLTAQTAPEKVADALCKCAETHEYRVTVQMLRSGDTAEIRERFEEVREQFFLVKKCAKSKVVLTKEEGNKVPEEEIRDALNKNCPDVAFLGDEYRRISALMMEEERLADVAARHTRIERQIAAKETDSVREELMDYKGYYGFASDRGPELVSYYYRIGDFEAGNAEALELIQFVRDDFFFYDYRSDQTIPITDFIRKELRGYATKYKQQVVIDALK